MPSLALTQLQDEFKKSLLYQDSTLSEQILTNSDFAAEQLIQIYRNNFIISVTDSLQCTYANTLLLVGEEFFNSVARAFILSQPPAINNICSYGDKFAEYLTRLEQLQDMPFVAEMARFECLLEKSKNLPLSCTRLDLNKLQQVSEQDHDKLVFTLRKNINLFTSNQDIKQLLELINNNQDEDVDINKACFLLLIKQANFEVSIKSISEKQWLLITQLQAQSSLTELTPASLQEELAELLKMDVIDGFYTHATSR